MSDIKLSRDERLMVRDGRKYVFVPCPPQACRHCAFYDREIRETDPCILPIAESWCDSFTRHDDDIGYWRETQ